MTDYVDKIKRGFRDIYGMKTLPGSTNKRPRTIPPDGFYPMMIDGKKDYVEVKDGQLHFCNFQKPKGVRFAEPVRKGRKVLVVK